MVWGNERDRVIVEGIQENNPQEKNALSSSTSSFFSEQLPVFITAMIQMKAGITPAKRMSLGNWN